MAIQDQRWSYEARFNRPGAPAWTLVAGPATATISADGWVTWTPSAADVGSHNFTIRAALGADSADQDFTVHVAGVTLEASAVVDPSFPEATVVAINAPLSPIAGASVTLPPGSLLSSTEITLSSLSNFTVPDDQAATGVSAADLLPVEFGPAGTVFNEPVRVQVPIPPSLAADQPIVIQTLDPVTSTWTTIPIISEDRENRVAVGLIHHFSPVVVTAANESLSISLQLGEEGSRCAAQQTMQVSLKNGWDGDVFHFTGSGVTTPPLTGTLKSVLEGLPVGGWMQVTMTAEAPNDRCARNPVCMFALGLRQASRHVWVTKQAADTYSLSVRHWGGSAFVISSVPNLERSGLTMAEHGALMGRFLSGQSIWLRAVNAEGPWRFKGNLYIAFGDHPSMGGIRSASLRIDAKVGGELEHQEGDFNCDGMSDSDVDAVALPPILEADPTDLVQTEVGATVRLSVTQIGSAHPVLFAADSPSVSLASVSEGVVDATVTAAGTFGVVAVAGSAPNRSMVTWQLKAKLANQAPSVRLASATASTVRLNTPVSVLAVGQDPDGDASRLTYQWTVNETPVADNATGTLTFTPTSSGATVVRCQASDGAATSAETSITFTVLAANMVPGAPTVTPNNKTLSIFGTSQVNTTLRLVGHDPDGSVQSFAFTSAGNTPPTYTLTPTAPDPTGNATAAFSATLPGTYEFNVSAVDHESATGPSVRVTIHVAALPLEPVDADHDGYPEGTSPGLDCDDSNPGIHPFAAEICADSVDQDCSGADTPAVDCDADGDGYPGAVDCDDTKAGVHPGATEVCDTLDNNCDTATDEGFDLGRACTETRDGCAFPGTLHCSTDPRHATCVADQGAECLSCAAQWEACNASSDCCPGTVCSVQHLCEGPTACLDSGATCADASECCSRNCYFDGISEFPYCAAPVCGDTGEACTSNVECCGLLVCDVTGLCAATCAAEEASCISNEECCSGNCVDDGLTPRHCGPAGPACTTQGHECVTTEDCCGGLSCGGASHVCEAPQCVMDNQPCSTPGPGAECCSGTCFFDGISPPTCAPTSACVTAGMPCATSPECCAGMTCGETTHVCESMCGGPGTPCGAPGPSPACCGGTCGFSGTCF